MRLKKIALLMPAVIGASCFGEVFAFSDLNESHWAYTNVMEIQEKGIVSGYNDGTFKPDAELTREQFITMLVNALGLTAEEKVNFTDIDNRWSIGYIEAAGYCLVDEGDTTFNPDEHVSREDVAMGLVKAKNLENSEYDVNTLNNFSDLNSISANRRKYVAIAVENRFMNGNANGTFNPKGALTRAEGATVIWNLLNSDGVVYKFEEIIQPIYDYAADFSEGLAVVKKDDKYGYIDKQGKQVVPLIYDDAKSYSGGLAIVKKNAKYGYINKSGEEIVPCIYDYICFEDDLIMLRKDRWGFTDRYGNEIVSPTYLAMPEFSEGLAAVRKDGKYGFIGKNGTELIPFAYDDAENFSENLAAVKKEDKWGYINKDGNEVIPFVYDYADNFSEGIAHVKKEGKVGYIDKNGNEIILGNYEWVDSIFEKVGVVIINKNYKGEYIGNLDEEIDLFSYSYELNDKLNAVLIVKGKKFGYIDENNVEIIPNIYDNLLESKGEMLKVRKDDKWGYINKDGNEVVPPIYDGIEAFSEELAAVKKEEKWGYINKAGEEVIPCIYEDARNFVEEFAAVKLNKTWRYINKEGKEIVLYNYDDVEDFSEGMAVIVKEGKYGFGEIK